MKPGSMWGNKMEARLRRYAANRMIPEDRVTMQRIGPHAPCMPKRGAGINPRCVYHLGLRRDQEAVDISTWFARRREGIGWRNGARVTKP